MNKLIKLWRNFFTVNEKIILNKLKNQEVRIINMHNHNGWGDRISWFSFEKRSVSGHMEAQPKVGDVMTCELASGRVGAFVFIDVRQCSDPRDMFFGTVKDLDYADKLGITQDSLSNNNQISFPS